MNSYKKIVYISLVSMLIFVVACVTINIYFPAEKVGTVAKDIVNEVRGQKAGPKDITKDKTSFLNQHGWIMTSTATPVHENTDCAFSDFMGSVFTVKNMIFHASPTMAFAGEETSVSNPTIRALKERLKQRFPRMKPYYQKGLLKEQDDGYVSIVTTGGLNLKQKRDLKNMVKAENKDRRELYLAIAKAMNISPSEIKRIAEIFADQWKKSVR